MYRLHEFLKVEILILLIFAYFDDYRQICIFGYYLNIVHAFFRKLNNFYEQT